MRKIWTCVSLFLGLIGCSQPDAGNLYEYLLAQAEEGNAEAQYQMGFMQKTGEGVEKNQEEGVRWFQLAATQGHREAQYYLGEAYVYGWGIEKDADLAVYWTRKAATQGHPFAMHQMGIFYFTGDGVPEDRQLSAAWLTLAVRYGGQAAIHALETVLAGPPQNLRVQAEEMADSLDRNLSRMSGK